MQDPMRVFIPELSIDASCQPKMRNVPPEWFLPRPGRIILTHLGSPPKMDLFCRNRNGQNHVSTLSQRRLKTQVATKSQRKTSYHSSPPTARHPAPSTQHPINVTPRILTSESRTPDNRRTHPSKSKNRMRDSKDKLLPKNGLAKVLSCAWSIEFSNEL